ncbi:MAG: ATP-binding protein [Tannerella sp.]|nr:ATP-binding protein [Tannerella sp.]
MKSTNRKRLPYGNSNFEKIRTEGYAYVDKTRFIELLEREESDKLFLVRPRKFGKSLFFSMLTHYYDVCSADSFETLFGDLYIGKHPTPKHNELMALKFNFSGIDTTTQDDFGISFTEKIESSVMQFLDNHKDFLPEHESLIRDVRTKKSVSGYLKVAFRAVASQNRKLFVIIDEYDHFANDFIVMGTPEGVEFYKQNIRANGIVRDFYETLKEGSETVIDRIMLTGITPVMLDDLTSGFNVAINLSLKPQYNEILGFTQEEAEWLMNETGIDPSRIPIDLKKLYDGYMFHFKGKSSVYNPSMMLYIFSELLDTDYQPELLMDENLKMDYGRLRLLLSSGQNREQLSEIALNSVISADIVPKFSLDELHNNANFVSLLFYFGLLTVDDSMLSCLKIPNQSIRSVYWEYFERMTRERDNILISNTKQAAAILELAYKSNPKPFLDYMTEHLISKISNRDLLNFDEKYIKVMLISRLMQSSLYHVINEPEFSTGYADIWLERSAKGQDIIPYEWIWELKYMKTSDSAQAVAGKFAEAFAQLEKYRSSYRLAKRRDVRYLAIIFIGKDKYKTKELPEK